MAMPNPRNFPWWVRAGVLPWPKPWQNMRSTRATELAEHFGNRTKGAVAAIKRSVYFGGSMSLPEGLHVERTEFLQTDQSEVGQKLMLDYLATTEAIGELPLYRPDTYAQALESGQVPGLASTNGAVSR